MHRQVKCYTDRQTYPPVEAWNRFATAWLLPIIFVVSGASLFYAVGKSQGGLRGASQFVKDKALRLLVPVLVCALTHASLQAYLQRLTDGAFDGSYFQYLPDYFANDFDWMGAHLWYLVVLFLFSALLYPLMRWLRGLLTLEAGPAFGTWRNALGWGCRALGSWCLVVAILGFARRHLNFGTARLNYANEAVLPFYILHQTVLLGVGYFVVQWAIPDLLKWGIILLVSFSIIMLLYEFLVRRFDVMRFLFGMKPRRKAPAARPTGAPRTLPSA
jgi:hypothetical protein